MEKRADYREIESEHSDEIAAALAAVYMYCQAEECAVPQESSAAETVPSMWLQASRFEGLNSNGGKFVSAIAAKSARFNWRNSFARRWTALSVGVIVCALFAAPVSALERIQFDPSSSTSKTNAAANSAPELKEDSAQNSKQFLCPVAPAMVLEKPVQPIVQNVDARAALPAADPQGAAAYNYNRTINIALSSSATEAEISCPDGARLFDESTHKLLAELPAQSRWIISLEDGPSGKRLSFSGKLAHARSNQLLLASGIRKYETVNYVKRFSSRGTRKGFTSSPVVVDSRAPKFSVPVRSAEPPQTPLAPKEVLRPVAYQTGPFIEKKVTIPPVVPGYIFETNTQDAIIACNGKGYRGKLTIKPRTEDRSFLLINNVDLEDYLLSVVPSEMPSGWNLEALKAQSIAARSYALANVGKHQSEGYDLKASTEDQVYLGIQTESDNSNRAVAETRGQVLKHNGKVVTAFFHSAGGGCTEKAEHVWGGKVPYLKSVPDFDDQSPHFNWNRSVAVSNIEEALKKQGRDIGGLLGIFPLERSPSQRVTLAMVTGTLQTLLLSGEELRKILALPSTAFNIGLDMDSYLVAGRGFGHGLGMSQWGAKYLSEQGYNASQILSYYYKDVTLDQF
jgi:stage II sporulation protein D